MRLFRLRGASGRPQHLLLALALATAGFLLAGTAQAQTIAGSSHDLSSDAEGQQAGNLMNGEVCVYCHTPHGGDTTAPAPLWNRSLASVGGPGGFQRYSDLNTTTLTGEEATDGTGSVSLACLSCHDGVQAMDTVINAPGRGNSTNTGSTLMTNADNSLAVIGTDLRDDHPVSIQYCGGGIDSGSTTDATNECALGDDYNDPATDTINGNKVWWLDTSTATINTSANLGAADDGIRQRTDIFLYSRSDFTAGGLQPSVECGSCHDPHVTSTTPTDEVNFMRISNTGSEVCLTCHNK